MSGITTVKRINESWKSMCRSNSCFFSSSDCDFAFESSKLMTALIAECECELVVEKCEKLKARKARSKGKEKAFIFFIVIHSFQ